MKFPKEHLIGVVVGLFVLITVVTLRPGIDARMRQSHAVIATGLHTESYLDKSQRMVSVTGYRWVKQDTQQDAAAYHALILLPSIPFADGNCKSTADETSHQDHLSWLFRHGSEESFSTTELEFDAKYDELSQTLTVEDQVYSLAEGNLFVVRLEENQRAQVTQLKVTNYDLPGSHTIREAFDTALTTKLTVK
jgi:hypothetical protein